MKKGLVLQVVDAADGDDADAQRIVSAPASLGIVLA
jgi:hypothetical protein